MNQVIRTIINYLSSLQNNIQYNNQEDNYKRACELYQASYREELLLALSSQEERARSSNFRYQRITGEGDITEDVIRGNLYEENGDYIVEVTSEEYYDVEGKICATVAYKDHLRDLLEIALQRYVPHDDVCLSFEYGEVGGNTGGVYNFYIHSATGELNSDPGFLTNKRFTPISSETKYVDHVSGEYTYFFDGVEQSKTFLLAYLLTEGITLSEPLYKEEDIVLDFIYELLPTGAPYNQQSLNKIRNFTPAFSYLAYQFPNEDQKKSSKTSEFDIDKIQAFLTFLVQENFVYTPDVDSLYALAPQVIDILNQQYTSFTDTPQGFTDWLCAQAPSLALNIESKILFRFLQNMKKIHTLISHDDITSVKQGLLLLESFVTSEAQLRMYIPYPKECIDISVLQLFLIDRNWNHRSYIYIWLIGMVAGLGNPSIRKTQRLSLKQNELVDLPTSLKNLTNLTHLDLRNNTLRFIPTDIISLPCLKRLDIRGLNVSDVIFPKGVLNHILYDAHTQWSDGFDHQNCGAIGPKANLSNTDLSGLDLSDLDLSKANFSNTNLTNTNLENAIIYGACFSNTELHRSTLNRARYDANTQWPDGFDYQNCGALGPNANLTGIDLSFADLSGLDLSNANLTKAILTGANLSQTKLHGANLSHANMERTILDQSYLLDTNLSGAQLNGANLSHTHLSGTNLKHAQLHATLLLHTTFEKVHAQHADFSETNLSYVKIISLYYDAHTQWPDGFDYQNCGAIGPKANLADRDLSCIDLLQCDLSGANLEKANVSDADLSTTQLSHASLQNTIYNEATIWPEHVDHKKRGAIFIGPNADLSGKNLSNMNLSGANLRGANLSGANLHATKIVGTKLQKANLSHTNLCDANLEGAHLEGANLFVSTYNEATTWPEHFDYIHSGSIGPKAILSNKDLSGVNLSGFHLHGVDFRGTSITSIPLHHALYDAKTKWPNGFHHHNHNMIGPTANLCGMDLQDIELSGENIHSAFYDEHTIWPKGFDYQNSGAIFIGPNADLSGKNLANMNLRRAKMWNVNLTDANLHCADLCETNLAKADLVRTNLSHANLQQASLSKTDMRSANISHANLMEADLRKSNLIRSNLHGAILSKTKLSGSIYDESTTWPDHFDHLSCGSLCIGPNADLSGKNLANMNLSGANLQGANLSGTNLKRAVLEGVNLTGASLVNTILEQAIYDDQTLWPQNFNPQAKGAKHKDQ